MIPPTISYLTSIYFECGMFLVTPDLMEEMGMKRALIVTDAGLLGTGMLDDIIKDHVVFSGVSPNPTEQNVTDGVESYRSGECDGILAIGGGSPIDCAKMIGVMCTHEGPLKQYSVREGGMEKITKNKPKLIAVPTTAGTGSEVGRAALISFGGGEKFGFLSPNLIPDIVVCDPELTLKLPARLTAGCALDAISHCVETYCSPKFNPVAEAIALDALVRACKNIEKVVNQGDDLSARQEMMMAALQAGMTFQKGLGLVHSLSHPLGGLEDKKLHHGELNGIFLPHVLEFNHEACTEKMAIMSSRLGISDSQSLPNYFFELMKKIESPLSLKQMDLTREDVLPLVKYAYEDHCTMTNPRVVKEVDCQNLYLQALDKYSS